MVPTGPVLKERARDFGADLVGIADPHLLAGEARTPDQVLPGACSVIVLARRYLWGAARLARSDSRPAHYSAELVISELEATALRLNFFLEDLGYPSLLLPASISRSVQEDMGREGPLSLPRAAVAAGLGTLGLNGMLLTPEYGPRVVLAGLVTLAPIEPDKPLTDGLCLGEACGRCLLSCPGSAIGRWALDVDRCREHSSPYGYWFVARHFENVATQPGPDERWKAIRNEDTMMIWQSMLRGVGVITGCTRCQDVCPVGTDFNDHLAEAGESIPEATPEKEAEVERMRADGRFGPTDANLRRWTGEVRAR